MKIYKEVGLKTSRELADELNSIDPEYNEITLTQKEFSDMYRLGYTLGTSTSGDYAKAKKTDYDQYKSGKDVNGDNIRRDKNGDVIKVFKKRD